MAAEHGTALAELLRKKKLSLLGEQASAATEFLESESRRQPHEGLVSARAQTLRAIVDWACGAINVDKASEEYWNTLACAVNALGRIDKWGSVLSSKLAAGVFGALPALLSEKATLRGVQAAQAALVGLADSLNVRPALPSLAPALEATAEALAPQGAPKVALIVLAQTLLGIALQVSQALPPRKLFEVSLKAMLSPLSKLRAALERLEAAPRRVLVPLPVRAPQKADENKGPTEASLSSERGIEEQAADALHATDQFLSKALFDPETLAQYESALGAWEHLGDAKRDQGDAKRHKSKKNALLVSYTRQLFVQLASLLAQDATAASASRTAPVLLRMFAAATQASGDGQSAAASLVHDRAEGEAEGPDEPEADASRKRKRDRSTSQAAPSLGLRFLLELFEPLRQTTPTARPHALAACASCLRVVVDFDLLNAANLMDTRAMAQWFSAEFSTWDSAAVDAAALLPARAAIVGVLLDIDHRILGNKLDQTLQFAYMSEPMAAHGIAATHAADLCLDFSPRAELLLRLIDCYVKLRQLGTLIPHLLSSATSSDGNGPELTRRAAECVAGDATMREATGALFARVPPGQVTELWHQLVDLFKEYTASAAAAAPADRYAALLAGSLLATFVEFVPLTERNIDDLGRQAARLRDEIKAEVDPDTPGPLLAAHAVLLQATSGVTRIARAWGLAKTDASANDEARVEEQAEGAGFVLGLAAAIEKVERDSAKPKGFEHSVLSRAVLQLVAAELRSSARAGVTVEGQAQTERLLHVLARGLDSPDNSAIVLEHLTALDGCRPSGALHDVANRVWRRAIELAVSGSADSPLCNAAFYELELFRNRAGEAISSAIAECEKRNTLLLIVSALPQGYVLPDCAERVFRAAMAAWTPDCHVGACRAAEAALRWNHSVVASKSSRGLVKLKALKSCVWTRSDKPAVDLARRIGGSLFHHAPPSFDRMARALMKAPRDSPDRELLFAVLLGAARQAGRDRSFRKIEPDSQDILIALAFAALEEAEALPSDAPARFALLAFLVEAGHALEGVEAAAELVKKTATATRASLKARVADAGQHFAFFLRATCRAWPAMRKTARATGFARLASAIRSARILAVGRATQGSGVEDPGSELDAATTMLYESATVEAELPLLLRGLLQDLDRVRAPASQSGPDAVQVAQAAVETLALVRSTLTSARSRTQLLLDIGGQAMLVALVRIGCSPSSGFPAAGSLAALAVVQDLIINVRGLWGEKNPRNSRVILEGVSLLASSASVAGQADRVDNGSHGELFKAGVNVFFALVKAHGAQLALRSSGVVVSVLTSCTTVALANLGVKADSSVSSSESAAVLGGSCPWLDSLDMLTRVCEELVPHVAAYQAHAVFWLNRYLQILKSVAVGPRVRDAIQLAAFYWLEMCGPEELQRLHIVNDEAGRALLKPLHEEFERSHRFRGKV